VSAANPNTKGKNFTVSGAKRLGLAGFFAIAVAFGPARNGYGLFLPYFNREFELSTEVSGVIASGLYAGYLLALSAVGLLAARVGPRPLVLIGGSSAAVGMALVALAPNAWVLAAGIILAGTSAGWSWAPYNDAADRMLPPQYRDRVLSVVSTGTTFGILAAGLVALAVGADWRLAWFAFALGAVTAAVPNAMVLPGGPSDSVESKSSLRRLGWAWLLRTESVPLFAVAFSFGVVSAFYFSFAVDLVVRAGGFSRAAAGPISFALIGAAGFVGLLTGDAVSRFGVGRVLLVTLASLGVAALLLGIAPSSWPVVAVSAALFGAGVMLMSALLSVWSSYVFPEQPSTGFSAALFVFGIGLVVGPAILGTFAGSFGLEAAFLATAALAFLTMLARFKVVDRASYDSRKGTDKTDQGGR
jgi:predicted MFS family arabinose efflux permease